MTATSSKAQTFYRRLYIAYLIDTGAAASVPAIVALTGMPRRTVQDAIKSLISMGVQCHFAGPNRTGHYVIDDWGPVDPRWITDNLSHVQHVVGCPSVPTLDS